LGCRITNSTGNVLLDWENIYFIYLQNQDIIDEQHRAATENDLTTSLQLSHPPKHFSPSDVLAKKKASGYDLIRDPYATS
jgi:hypothetical protein